MSINRIRSTFIITQIIVVVFGILYTEYISNSNNYSFILLYSLWNIISYGSLFYFEIKYAPDFNPYQVLCLSCMVFTGTNGLDIYHDLINGNSLSFGVFTIDAAIHLGLLYLSVQHIIIFATFYIFEKKYFRSGKAVNLLDSIKCSRTHFYKKALTVYGFVWLLRAISFFVPVSSLGSLFVYFMSRGHLITLFLLVFERIKNPGNKKTITIHWIIVVIEVIRVLGHGMKEDIIVTIIPYCIYWALLYKSKEKRMRVSSLIPMALVSLFVLGFVFPYVSIFRTIANEKGKKWSEISVSEVLEDYSLYVKKEGIYARDETERGLGYFMYRAGSIGCNAWSIDYAQTYGPTPQFARYCAIAVVPRVLWRNKPAMVTGGMVSSLALGDATWLTPKDASEYGNSMSLGFIGAGYFSFGFWGAILVVFLNALFLSILWNYCRSRIHYNIFAIIIVTNYLMLFLKDFEAFQDCGMSFMATHLVYLLIAIILDKLYYKI